LHLITLRHTTLVRPPLDGGLTHHPDLYLTSHNTTRCRHLCPRRN